jgi:hypothetical protein
MRKDYYTRLRHSYIVGYIDYLDIVHSEIFCYLDDDDNYDSIKTHNELFGKVLKGFRWDYDNCLNWSNYSGVTTSEDRDLIRNHLTSKYKIPFYENGYHDVKYFCKMMNEEENI